ncbi:MULTISPECIES: recombination regulator RecX [unclassified Streptomyces]|uniref:recombination regulator RecX n=1 Tax=unclassified Streptomyces TaxID=2593676 RepID=UPI002E7FFF4C|nr:recombination regulator RecX [Streptomyces sp. NBC_00589]WTI35815.1 recombination regulator RecX [Streptomyces sp. NBC_00775]WUB30511.1 recombination regulator RecX [Streptomyces sp. NBC_00589]
MTRRTDWAEYAYPADPEGPGQGYHGGDSGSAGDGDGGYGGAGAYDGGTYGPDDGFYGAERGVEGFYGGDPGAGSDGGPDGEASPDGGSRRGERQPGGHGSPGGASRRGGGRRGDGGARGGRGRRRRGGFGEPSGDPQDGGAPSSSRAEKGEPPGDPAERARAICLRLLTGTPRTRKQLADALRKREIPDDVADEVLSRFEEVGLINDSAFADAWVESRHHGRGLARRALAQELRTKGVDSTLIDEAVGQLDSEQEEATARELVARKLRSTRGLDRDKRLRRLAGMLARKGYSEGMALRVVRQALEEEGEDTEGLGDEGF